MKSLLLVLFIIAAAFTCDAQTILLNKTVEDTTVSNFGPNKKHHIIILLGYGFAAGSQNAGTPINYGRSFGFTYTMRYKRRVGQVYAWGFDFGYRGMNYSIAQVKGKAFADSMLHKKEELSFASLEMGLYNRFNFDKRRGNSTGVFLDLGLMYHRHLGIAHATWDDRPNGNEVQVITRNLNYIDFNSFDAIARFGRNSLIFTAAYRLTPAIKGMLYKDVPPLVIGIQLGLFN